MSELVERLVWELESAVKALCDQPSCLINEADFHDITACQERLARLTRRVEREWKENARAA